MDSLNNEKKIQELNPHHVELSRYGIDFLPTEGIHSYPSTNFAEIQKQFSDKKYGDIDIFIESENDHKEDIIPNNKPKNHIHSNEEILMSDVLNKESNNKIEIIHKVKEEDEDD